MDDKHLTVEAQDIQPNNSKAEVGSPPDNENKSQKRGNLMTSTVTAALDRVGMTDRNAEHLLNALIKDKHLDSSKNSYSVNYSSIRRHRMKNREKLTEEVF